MRTKKFSANDIEQAATLIKQGELVAFPTETVYGLGANALDEQAVKQVYQVKGRPSDNPLIVHVSGFDMVKAYVSTFPKQTQQLVDDFWPGPLTLIFSIKPGVFSSVVTGGLNTVAFRMPNNACTLSLIKAAGVPLVGPSANTSGKPSPTTAEHVYHDLKGKIAGILDDGAAQIGVESTVLDLTAANHVPMILRPGAVTRQALAQVVGPVSVDQHLLSENEKPKAPGMKYKHYAPNTPVWIVAQTEPLWQTAINQAKQAKKKVGLLASEKIIQTYQADVTATFSFGANTPEQGAKLLFAGLRALDEQGLDLLLVQAFPETGIGVAYMNRLKKAANQKFFKKDSIFQ